MSSIVIQKFGGSSLADEALRSRAVEIVRRQKAAGDSPVVVVSAIGRAGAPYATDSLLELPRSCGGRLQGREQDLILSCGEVISAVVMSQSIVASGMRATALTGGQAGILTEGDHTNSHVVAVETSRLRYLLDNGLIPVVAGFQGISRNGEVTTISRGGSDTTAAVLGAALGARCVEIFTDVEGIMTADPNVEPEAKCLAQVDYGEARALAINGGKVIHPPALEAAAKFEIPVHIRSLAGDSVGTLVHLRRHDSPVSGVACSSDIAFFSISPDTEREHATNLGVFRLIANSRISVHFIDVRPHEITFVVESEWRDDVLGILEAENFNTEIDDGFAKVSVIGLGMTGQPGMMATIVDTLSHANVRIYQSTDAQTSISCLIRKEDRERAVHSLHAAFELNE